MELFKKGQLVPKRIGMVFIHKKARCAIKFGCDVSVQGKVIIATTEGPIITVAPRIGRKSNNGTWKKETARFIGRLVGIPYITKSGVRFL